MFGPLNALFAAGLMNESYQEIQALLQLRWNCISSLLKRLSRIDLSFQKFEKIKNLQFFQTLSETSTVLDVKRFRYKNFFFINKRAITTSYYTERLILCSLVISYLY